MNRMSNKSNRHLSGLFIILTTLISLELSSQTTQPAKQPFKFNEITFHVTGCKTACPEVSMNILANRKIQVTREVYNSRHELDTVRSGGFKGTLDPKEFNKLLTILSAYNFEKLVFPKVLCCDSSVKTLIVTYNDESKRFQSMTPPLEARKLISYLTDLALRVRLKRVDGAYDFEM